MELDWIFQLLKEVNIAQILIMFCGMWFFYNRLDSKIDKTHERIDRVEAGIGARIDKTNERIDKLSEKVEDIDRRLCRIEGSLTTHGHCLFKQGVQDQKVL